MIYVCGLYLLSEEGKSVKRKYWIHKVFPATEEQEEFHTLFGRIEDDRQKFFKFSKFENFKELLPTDNQKENTQWRLSIKKRIKTGFNFKVSSYSI